MRLLYVSVAHVKNKFGNGVSACVIGD